MKPRVPSRAFGVFALFLAAAPGLCAAARVLADVQPAQKRQSTLELAQGLARRPAPEALPADLASPFNPPGFDRPDPAGTPSASKPASAPASAPSSSPVGSAAVSAPAGAAVSSTPRETLEAIAAQITPSGTIVVRGKPRLFIAGRSFEVGTRFTATYNNEDYELELVAIDRTTFTLRYRGEDVTRPIKPAR